MYNKDRYPFAGLGNIALVAYSTGLHTVLVVRFRMQALDIDGLWKY